MKRVFNESFSAPSKTPWRIQSDLSYDLRLERYSDLRGHSMYIATRRARLEARGAGFLVPKNLRTLKTNFEKADGLGIRPGFKFSAKIEMYSSQILAII